MSKTHMFMARITRTRPRQLQSFQKYSFFLACQKPICLWHLRVSSITKQPGHDQANSFSLGPLLFFSSGVPLALCVTYCLFIGAATFCYVKYFKLCKRTWPEEGKQANKTEPFVMRATEQSFRCTLAAEIS